MDKQQMTESDLRRLVNAAEFNLSLAMMGEREDYLPDGVGNAAASALEYVFGASMIGLDEDARPILIRSLDWLRESPHRNKSSAGMHEYLGPYLAAIRAESLALARWLADDDPGAEEFGAAVPHWQEALDHLDRDCSPAAAQTRQRCLSALIRDSLSAGWFDAGAAAYLRYVGPLPQSAADVESPADLAGWLCQALGAGDRPAEWVAAGTRVLRENLPEWAVHGHGREAAAWLKLVFWDSGAALTAEEAMHRGGELIGARRLSEVGTVLLDS